MVDTMRGPLCTFKIVFHLFGSLHCLVPRSSFDLRAKFYGDRSSQGNPSVGGGRYLYHVRVSHLLISFLHARCCIHVHPMSRNVSRVVSQDQWAKWSRWQRDTFFELHVQICHQLTATRFVASTIIEVKTRLSTVHWHIEGSLREMPPIFGV